MPSGSQEEHLRLLCSPSVVSALLAAAQLQVRCHGGCAGGGTSDAPGAQEQLPADVRAEAARCAACDDVPWRLLRRVCRALREAQHAGDETAKPEPWLQELARSGGLRLRPPSCRQRSDELEQRVAKLRIQAEERNYQSLVRDVTRAEREERERVPISSTVREVGFGMHVITVMASCFLAGLVLGRRLFSDRGAQFAVGAVCMLFSLLVETALFVIQDSSMHTAAEKARMKTQ